MTTNPITRKARRRNDYQKAKSAAGVAARERIRMERAGTWTDVGGLSTDGVLGKHSVRLLASEHYGPRLAVTVDGRHRDARTLRGVIRCIALMVFDEMTKGKDAK